MKHALSILLAILCLTFVGNSFAEELNPQPEQPVKEEPSTSGWFRVDSDALSLQLWAGATHKVGPVNISSLMYVNSAQLGEFDLGVTLSHQSFTIIPMIGTTFDWGQRKMVSLVPEAFIYLTPDKFHLESWVQLFINEPFGDVPNQFYTRDFFLYQVHEYLFIGPQVELLTNLNSDGVVSLPVGGRANVVYGPADTFGFFLGYELIDSAREFVVQEATDTDPAVTEDRGLVGRLTYVHTW